VERGSRLGSADPATRGTEGGRCPSMLHAPDEAPTASRAGRGQFRLLLWVVAAAPIPLGAVFPVAAALLATAVGLLLLGAGLGALRTPARGNAVPESAAWPYTVPFLAAVGWAGLQATSWMPVGWHNPLWTLSAAALARHLPGAVSVDPYETLSAVMHLLCYGGVFWLALRLCRVPSRAEFALLCVTAVGALQASYALADVFSGANLVLWYPKIDYAGMATGTFFNRNTYATYAGLCLVCASALIARGLFDQLSPVAGRAARRFRWWLLPAWMLLATALLLSQSRGGVLATLAGLVAFLAAIALAGEMLRRARGAAAALILALALSFLAISGGAVASRLLWADTALENRAEIWADAIDEIARRPFLGDGYGTFAEVYPSIRTHDEAGDRYVDKAHNTYIEEALELGIPAEGLLILALAAATQACLRGLARGTSASAGARADPAFRTVAAATGIGASVLVAVHSLVDFSLQIPALAATYAFILGASLAGASPQRPHKPGSSPWRARVGALLPLSLGATILILAVPRVAADTLLLPGDRVLRAVEDGASPSLRDLTILEASRSQAFAWSASGRIGGELALAKLLRSRSQPGLGAEMLRLSAMSDLEDGLSRAPADPYGWTRLSYAHIEAAAPVPEILPILRMAVRTGPFQPDLLLPRLRLWLSAAPYFTAEDKVAFLTQTRLAWSHAPDQLAQTARAAQQIELVRAALPAADWKEFDRLLDAPLPQASASRTP
jgi:O-antigen ligase